MKKQMHCSGTRELLHDWFDANASGGGAMPSEAALHIRDCVDCRDFVRQWDRIELSLQTLKDSAPSPSLDFRISLEKPPARVKKERPASLSRRPAVYGRWAAAATAAIIAILGLTYALTGRGLFPNERAGTLSIVRPAPNANYAPPPFTLDADLPLARTR